MTKVKLDKNNIKSEFGVQKHIVKKEKSKINYSNFIKKLRHNFTTNPYKFDVKIILNQKIEYEDFIKIIISRNLSNFLSKDWKHLINNYEQYDNTYPLFWACEHACLNEVKLLIKNGSEFKPKGNEETSPDLDVKKDCFEVVLSMISADSYYDKICYKKFRNKPLNDFDNKLFNDFNNYKLILEELMNNYATIFENDYFDYEKFKNILTSNSIEIIKYFLQKVDLYPIYLKILLFELFGNTIKLMAKKILEIRGIEKDLLCYKEFKRVKLIFIVKLVTKFFMKCGIEKYDAFDKKVENIFGTYNKSNLSSTKLFSEKLSYFRSSDYSYIKIFFDNDIEWYKDMSKLFDNLIKRYKKELDEFME